MQTNFHISPGLKIESLVQPFAGVKLDNSLNKNLCLALVENEGTRVNLCGGWISYSYGRREPGKVISFETSNRVQKTLLIVQYEEYTLKERIARVLNNEKYFLAVQ